MTLKDKSGAIYFAIAILVVIGIYSFFGKESWIGFYYPDRYNLTQYIQSSELQSLEECRAWVNVSQVPIHNPSGEGYDYECGKNCRLDENFDGYICKETVR